MGQKCFGASWIPERQVRQGKRKSRGRAQSSQQSSALAPSLLEQLQDANHDVIDVTKTRSLEETETPKASE